LVVSSKTFTSGWNANDALEQLQYAAGNAAWRYFTRAAVYYKLVKKAVISTYY